MASGDNVCFSSLLTAWRRPCALEFMSERRAVSSPLEESKFPVNCGGGKLSLRADCDDGSPAYQSKSGEHLVNGDFESDPIHARALLLLLVQGWFGHGGWREGKKGRERKLGEDGRGLWESFENENKGPSGSYENNNWSSPKSSSLVILSIFDSPPSSRSSPPTALR